MRHCKAVSAILLVCALAAPGQSTHLLKPKPLLPIDCSGNNTQPCTGTQCVSQQTDIYCAETHTTYTCENDAQNYTGGPWVCCTGKNPCFDCPYNGRTIHYYGYYGVTQTPPNCVYNPPY